MTVGQLVNAIITASTRRDGYYLEKNPDAVVPMMRLCEWITRARRTSAFQ